MGVCQVVFSGLNGESLRNRVGTDEAEKGTDYSELGGLGARRPVQSSCQGYNLLFFPHLIRGYGYLGAQGSLSQG